MANNRKNIETEIFIMNLPTDKMNGKTDKLVEAFENAIEAAFNEIDFPLECLDWLSYNPDFHIEKHYKKAA